MRFDSRKIYQKLNRLIISPGLEPAQQSARIHAIERDIVLPIKALIILTVLYYFYFSNWLDQVHSTREVAFETIRKGILSYTAINIVVGAIFIYVRHLQLALIQWITYTMGLLDGLFFAALAFVTDGFDSIVFWMFPPLILRNAITVPHATPQIALNLAVNLCYVLAGILDVAVSKSEDSLALDADTRLDLSIGAPENPMERIVILLLWTLCCTGVQMLFEKHRRAMEEAIEFAARQEQLQTAGRLAAEIAHRIKNPLSIINNSAYSLDRSSREGKNSTHEQIEIIREEVNKADRILTELMGYAQLAEGRVEKLDVTEELERAIAEALPSAAKYEIDVKRDYAEALPYLMMQRGHLSEIFVNLLKNAREALNNRGQIEISAQHGEDYSVIVTIADNGPGIPADKTERIFEAYFSTKEKGTGLGLSIVRHNIEIYGGKVEVQSELGKGARFILKFPVKTVMKFSK